MSETPEYRWPGQPAHAGSTQPLQTPMPQPPVEAQPSTQAPVQAQPELPLPDREPAGRRLGAAGGYRYPVRARLRANRAQPPPPWRCHRRRAGRGRYLRALPSVTPHGSRRRSSPLSSRATARPARARRARRGRRARLARARRDRSFRRSARGRRRAMTRSAQAPTALDRPVQAPRRWSVGPGSVRCIAGSRRHQHNARVLGWPGRRHRHGAVL